MNAMAGLNELSAVELAGRTRAGAVSAVDVATAVIARIEARQPGIEAFAWFDPEAVLAQARALDAAPVRGPLHGVPVAVKDVFDTGDMPDDRPESACARRR
jgi:amidase